MMVAHYLVIVYIIDGLKDSIERRQKYEIC